MMNNRFFLVVPLLMVCCALTPSAADPGDDREALSRLSYGVSNLDSALPHTRWAKPLSGGPIRALVMTPTITHRETIELAARLEMDVAAWLTASPIDADGSGGSLSEDPAVRTFMAGPQVVQEALRKAMQRDYQVYIVGKLHWETIPQDQRDEMIRRVRHGAGLVYVQPVAQQDQPIALIETPAEAQELQWVVNGVPIRRFDVFQRTPVDNLIEMGGAGAGRVVILNYQDPLWSHTRVHDKSEKLSHHSLTPVWDDPRLSAQARETLLPEPLGDLEVPYDYAHSLLARAVLWAAGRTPAQRLHLQLPDQFDREGDRPALQITTSGTTTDNVEVAVGLRDGTQHKLLAQERIVVADGTLHVPLPALPRGSHFVDVWLRKDGQTIDWASVAFEVTAPVICRQINLDHLGIGRGEAVTGRLVFDRPLAVDESAILEVRDNLGWIRARRVLATVPTNEAPFTLPIADPFVARHVVCVRIMRGEVELEKTEQPFYINDRSWGEDFRAVAWHGVFRSRPHEYINQQLRALGFDAVSLDHNSTQFVIHPRPHNTETVAVAQQVVRQRVELALDNNVQVINYSWSQLGSRTVGEPGQFFDESFKADGQLLRPFGSIAYVTSEPFAADAEFEPDTQMAAYRRYLKEVYRDIASLNQSWETNYASFEETAYIGLEEARQSGRYAQWADFRLFMEAAFARKLDEMGSSFVAGDPDALHGYDAALYSGPYDGLDIWLTSRLLTCLHSYHYPGYHDGMMFKMFRDFARPGTITGTWTGSYGPNYDDLGPANERFNRFYPWSCIFNGLNSAWWWPTTFDPIPSTGNSTFTSGGDPLPHLSRTMQEIRQIKAGPGKALLAADREDYGIAILYSAASRHGTALLPRQVEPIMHEDGTLDAFPLAQGNAGIEWMRAMKDWGAMLEDIGLQYRIISYAQLADGLLLNEKYKVLILPFCVSLSDAEIEAIRRFVEGGGVVLADRIPGVLDAHCRPRDNRPLDGVFPQKVGWKSRSFGEGKGILLGSFLDNYHKGIRKPGHWRQGTDLRRAFTTNFLQAAGVKPFARLSGVTDKPIPPTEVSIFKKGPIIYLGLLRDYQIRDSDSYPAVIHLPAAQHVYNMRTGTYLGHVRLVRTTIDSQAQLYVCLPYRVDGVTLRTTEPTRGAPLRVEASLDTTGDVMPGDHVYRIRLLDASKEEMDGFARNVTSNGGRSITEIFVPFNLDAGQYELEVKDVLSGLIARQTLGIAP